jgi:hypothetical protein
MLLLGIRSFFLRRLALLNYAKDSLFDRLKSRHVLSQIMLKIWNDVNKELTMTIAQMKEIAMIEDG